MQKVELIATATFGLEAVVAEEVKKLGCEEVRVDNGKVTFRAGLSAIPRANLWLRTADRVRLKLGEFRATTFEELFEQTKALPWEEWIPEDGAFPVEGKSVKSTLFSVPDCQAIVKKAVVERLKQTYRRDWFEETGPLYKIEVALLKDTATLTIDTSGPGLHKRGYRQWIGAAPLKETLAAAMILLSRWQPDQVLYDPFCGSGTIPIEAALIGQNIAPGLNRSFASEQWPTIPRALWREARAEAHDLAAYGRKLEIIGTDIDGEVLKVARHNAAEAAVEGQIHFQRMAVGEWRTRKKYGCLIGNPPYGERLGSRGELAGLYRNLRELMQQLDSWSFYLLTADERLEYQLGKQASKKRKLYNGNLKVDYYQFFGPRPPRPKPVGSAEKEAEG
ncbi:THUMP domain-containing class I SAM-dependent RNA methyltransferase [Brevibacillus marinus]|uniref:THUMP domain-containing class I SAM-dependent RNA methyltransferase n=1 Tax=Brevibacillus marinus TaxID=2496837 RepID=UPI000F819826|nr:class I SAM-dependent RNA methyltransferase [Brevibacillus marinus]